MIPKVTWLPLSVHFKVPISFLLLVKISKLFSSIVTLIICYYSLIFFYFALSNYVHGWDIHVQIGVGLVLGTFLCAPIMFIFARIITLYNAEPSDYASILGTTVEDISWISIVCCVSLLISFVCMLSKWYFTNFLFAILRYTPTICKNRSTSRKRPHVIQEMRSDFIITHFNQSYTT